MRKVSALFAVAMVATLGLAACTAGGPAEEEQTLVVVTGEEPENFDTPKAATNSQMSSMMRNIFDALLKRDIETGEIVSELAESWTAVDDVTWEFKLREGVTFHDGSPLNAEGAALALTTDYVKEKSSFVGAPATFEAVDEYTLRMVTETPDPIVPARMTMIVVTSAQQIEEDAAGRTTHPIGTGPYQFVEWNRGSDIQLDLYPESWRAVDGMYDAVDWVFRAEPAVRGQMIQAGEADIASFLTEDQCGTVECTQVVGMDYFFFRPDQYNQDFLGNNLVRQALAHAINREGIAEAFLNGGDVLDNPDPKGSIGYDDSLDGNWTYDPELAGELLAEAAAEGVDITTDVAVVYPVPILNWASLVDAFVADMQAAGFTAHAEPVPIDDWNEAFTWTDGRTLLNDLPSDRNAIYASGNANELFDFSFTAGLFYTCEGRISTYCNPEVDALYEAALPLGGEERQEALAEMWALAYEDVALLPISHTATLWAFSERGTMQVGRDNGLPLESLTKE